MAGTAQQAPHLARPVFFLDLDQRLQFTQMMHVARRVQRAVQRVVGLPVVVHDNASDIRQKAAPLRRDAVERQQDSRCDMQPLIHTR